MTPTDEELETKAKQVMLKFLDSTLSDNKALIRQRLLMIRYLIDEIEGAL